MGGRKQRSALFPRLFLLVGLTIQPSTLATTSSSKTQLAESTPSLKRKCLSLSPSMATATLSSVLCPTSLRPWRWKPKNPPTPPSKPLSTPCAREESKSSTGDGLSKARHASFYSTPAAPTDSSTSGKATSGTSLASRRRRTTTRRTRRLCLVTWLHGS